MAEYGRSCEDLLINVDNLQFLDEYDDKKLEISSTNNLSISKFDNSLLRNLSDDNEKPWVTYVTNLFEIYQQLEDHKSFSVPTIGLINRDFAYQHNKIVDSAFQLVITELELFIETISSDETQSSKQLDLENCLSIMNCLSIFYFSSHDEEVEYNERSTFVERLSKWVNRSDGALSSEYMSNMLTKMNEKDAMYENDLFWDILSHMLLRGLFSQALEFLTQSKLLEFLTETCEVSFNAVTDAISLITEYPLDSNENFRNWKALVLGLQQAFSDSETKVSASLRQHIENTLLLITGNRKQILKNSKTWYEAVSGFFLFYIPSFELQTEYLQLSLNEHPLDVTNSWEQKCVDLINKNINSIFPTLQTLDFATATFVALFCETKGLIDNSLNDETDVKTFDDISSPNLKIATYLLNSFSLELCSLDDKSLWPIAIGLISESPSNSDHAKRVILANLLPKYPYSTNDDLEWLLTICAKWRLASTTKEIYKILAEHMIADANIVEAMTNYSKAGDFEQVINLSWKLFEDSITTGKPLDDDVLNFIVDEQSANDIPKDLINAVVTDTMRQTLAPYAILYKFYQFMDKGELEQSLTLLLVLMEFKFIHKQHFLLLSIKFLYNMFLNKQEVKLNEDEILRILEALNNNFDIQNEECRKTYRKEYELQQNNLPETIEEFERTCRKKLNFKLSEEFI